MCIYIYIQGAHASPPTPFMIRVTGKYDMMMSPSVKRSVSLGGWASVDVRVRECALEGFVRVPKLACNEVIFGKIRRLQTHANERIYDLVLQTIGVHLVLCVRVLGREVVWVCAKSLFRLASVMTL